MSWLALLFFLLIVALACRLGLLVDADAAHHSSVLVPMALAPEVTR